MFDEAFESLKEQFVLNFLKEDRWKLLVKGLGRTLGITFFAVILGIIIGIFVAAICSSFDKNKESLAKKGGFGYAVFKIANGICRIYLTVIRGTPVAVQLLIGYFIIFQHSSNGFMVSVIIFGINSGAYVAEIFRSGIMSVDNGQFEAGRSLGFTYAQTMRHIVIPQAFKTVLPTLCNEFIALLKETSVAGGYIGIEELTKAGAIIRSRTFSPYMPLFAVAGLYLLVVLILSKIFSVIERRLRKSER